MAKNLDNTITTITTHTITTHSYLRELVIPKVRALIDDLPFKDVEEQK